MLLLAILIAVSLTDPQLPPDYERGCAAYDAGQYSEAKEYLRSFLLTSRDHPLYPDALYHYGRLEEDGEKARAIFLHLVANYPGSSVVSSSILMIGKYHYANEEFEEASVWLEKLISTQPGGELAREAGHWLELTERGGRSASWAIQAGAFRDRENAQELIAELKRSNFPVVLIKRESTESVLWLVRVGYYRTRAEALASQRRLKGIGYQTYLVEKQWRN